MTSVLDKQSRTSQAITHHNCPSSELYVAVLITSLDGRVTYSREVLAPRTLRLFTTVPREESRRDGVLGRLDSCRLWEPLLFYEVQERKV